MLEWLKSMWAKYKVHVSVVGGALVVASVYGKCTIEPSADAIEDVIETSADPEANNASATEIPNMVPVATMEVIVAGDAITVNTEDDNTESVEGTETVTTENNN
jgi:hypothetical protein